jgi:hypothetical protein
MKIRNEDLVKLNQLKFDLLSPPCTFKLRDIAVGYIDSTIETINKYVPEDNSYAEQLNKLKVEIESASDMPAIRRVCEDDFLNFI